MKKIAFLVVVSISMLLLFACGSGKSNDNASELTVLTYLDRANTAEVKNFEAILTEFQKQNPDITLKFDYLTNEPYHNKLQAMNIADQLPDLFMLWPGKRTGQVTDAGKAKDLRPWLTEYQDTFLQTALGPQGPNGEIYELPENITVTHVMYTNDALLQELGLTFPKTFEELLAQGQTIRDAGYIPIAMDNKDGWQMQSTLLSALMERTGGREWVEAARDGKASFADKEFVDALSVIKTLSDENMFSPGINQAEYGRALTDFITGKAVYFIDGSWRAVNIRSEATEDFQKSVSLRVFPKLSNEKGQANATSAVPGIGFGMNAKLSGAKADNAWKWILFYAGEEGAKIRLQQGWLTAYKVDIPDDAPVMTKKMAEFIKTFPAGHQLDNIMDPEGMGLLYTSIQQMMLGGLTAQQAAAKYEEWVAANDSNRKQ